MALGGAAILGGGAIAIGGIVFSSRNSQSTEARMDRLLEQPDFVSAHPEYAQFVPHDHPPLGQWSTQLLRNTKPGGDNDQLYSLADAARASLAAEHKVAHRAIGIGAAVFAIGLIGGVAISAVSYNGKDKGA
jgi:hypothetical protein